MPTSTWKGQVITALVGSSAVLALVGYFAFNTATQTVPAPGGTLVEGLAGSPTNLNPLLAPLYGVDQDFIPLLFNGLTKVTGKGDILPDLAESWTISPDGRSYAFQLRKDIKWHDGAPFTAEDVIYTVRVLQHPDYPGPPDLARLWRNVAAEQDGDFAVKFTLKDTFTPFLEYTSIPLLPAHLLAAIPVKELGTAQFNAQPVGTGMYRIKEVSAKNIILEANPNYHGARPFLARLQFKFYINGNAALNALAQGEVMAVGGLSPGDLPKLRENPRLAIYSSPLSGYAVIFLNLKMPFFQDRLVRQALIYAIDRQKLIDVILGGQGQKADSPILPSSWAYNPRVKRYDYNPEQARALLDKAGWKVTNGVREKDGIKLEFTLRTNDDGIRTRLIQEVSRELTAVGVKVDPQVSPAAELVREFLVPRRFDALLYMWANLPSDPDPYEMWHSSQTGEDGLNFCFFANRQADELLENARRTLDRTERARMYQEFQDIFAAEAPAILLYYPMHSYAVNKEVKGVQVGPLTSPSDRFRQLDQWYIATQKKILTEKVKVR